MGEKRKQRQAKTGPGLVCLIVRLFVFDPVSCLYVLYVLCCRLASSPDPREYDDPKMSKPPTGYFFFNVPKILLFNQCTARNLLPPPSPCLLLHAVQPPEGS